MVCKMKICEGVKCGVGEGGGGARILCGDGFSGQTVFLFHGCVFLWARQEDGHDFFGGGGVEGGETPPPFDGY